MTLKPISIKDHPTLNEKWVQDRIAENPSILELGDLILKDRERRQVSNGRLDLLLQNLDQDNPKRYEVEIQLGAVDESHIIRTIEYWDLEKKRYPQYKHSAVIIAEDITSRFLNIIHLFNGHIPLIALKMSAYEIHNEIYLTFVKVLDEVNFGLIDDESATEPSDRDYWEKKTSPESLKLFDSIYVIIKKAGLKVEPKYNKHYIGFSLNNVTFNFAWCEPKKNSCIISFKLPNSKENDSKIDGSSFEKLTYNSYYNFYRIRVEFGVIDIKQEEVLIDLFKSSYSYYESK